VTGVAEAVTTGPLSRIPEFKGAVIIEWPQSARRGRWSGALHGCLTAVYDAADEQLIPAARVTVHAEAGGLVTADVAVFLGKDGEILRDPERIAAESDGIPAAFPFLVAEMRVRP